jgi:hypothetical protein
MKTEHKKALKTLVFAQSFVEALDDFGGSIERSNTNLNNKGLSFC